jgi:peptidyl-prolyl cis-trans isomerase C
VGFHHDEAEEEQVPFRLEGASGAGGRIVVTAAKRRWLDEHLARQWRRPPTAAESDRSVADFVREEVLYREALALGLDRDDLVVRRRLVQKMEMLALRDAPGITESGLMDYYLAHSADYALPGSVSFRHVFFSTAARNTDARADAGVALGEMRDHRTPGTGPSGDPPPMPPEVSDWTRPMVAERFGTDFAASVFDAEPGGWSGPVASAYGYHLVYLTRHAPPRLPDFAEVAGRIATDLDAARRSGALDRIYATARGAYQVEIEPAPASPPAHPSHEHVHEHAERTRS